MCTDVRTGGRVLALALAIACAGPSCEDGGGADEVPVTVRFAARLGPAGDTVRCGASLGPLGTSGATYAIEDLRFYVHELALVTEAGEAVPVTLADDHKWQDGAVALLDFEDRTEACQNGTTDTNDAVVGSVPSGTYRGLRFKVGVPVAKNHLDTATARPPLDLTGMWWGWTLGYKFLRLDGKTAGGMAFSVHLGSIGCTRSPTAEITCSDENVVDVHLDDFDAASDVVVFDLAALLATSDIAANAPPSAGCMSDLADTDCPKVFGALGLAFDGQPAPGPQRVFVTGAP